MQIRHWIAIASLAGAAAVLLIRRAAFADATAASPQLWNWVYWGLLVAAGVALFSRRRPPRR